MYKGIIKKKFDSYILRLYDPPLNINTAITNKMPYTTLTMEDMELMTEYELAEKVIELQDLLEETAKTAKETAPRKHTERRKTRLVRIEGGRMVMGYVLGKRFSNSNRIQNEVREMLKTDGERIDGLCITINNRDLSLTLWSHTDIGLDLMEEKIQELMREGQDKVASGELRPRPTRHHDSRHRDHHYRDDHREHRHRDHSTPARYYIH